MIVRLLDKAYMGDARALWKEAFADSDAFIDWYFKHKVLPGNSLGAFDEGGLVSMLHMIPYTIRLQGKAARTMMIAGAATKRERRGEGHMRTLLLASLEEMRERGIFLTILYPFKHSFYERFGWATVTRVHRGVVTEAPLRRDVEVIETDDYHALESIYSRMMRGYDGCVLRGSREWRWRMGELKADGGRAAVLVRDDIAVAYMLFYMQHAKAEVVETAYADEEDIGALLSYILRQGCKRVNYALPTQSRGAKHGMARVVDAKALLRFLDAEALLKDIRLRDEFAPWNRIGEGPEGTETDIASLAHIAYAGGGKISRKCTELFVSRDTCIFEMF